MAKSSKNKMLFNCEIDKYITKHGEIKEKAKAKAGGGQNAN